MLSTGFFVKAGDIYDANGHRFIMKGINHTHWWGDQANSLAAIPELKKTGANTVRVVFGENMGANTPAEKREVVESYLANGIVPIVEEHRGTCDESPSTLANIFDVWLDPENAAWLKDHERHIILNVANEWGPTDAATWAAAYEEGIARLRGAGIHNLVIVDAGGNCGQNHLSVLEKGNEIFNADPEHNVAFSIHLYAFWRTSEAGDIGSWGDDGSPWEIGPEFQKLRDSGLAIVAGELAWDGTQLVRYDNREALNVFAALGIGYIVWVWNQADDAAFDMLADGNGYQFNSDADLSEGGQLFIADPEVGIRATAHPSTAF